jgi:flagellar hook-associated protein 3 FlgL
MRISSSNANLANVSTLQQRQQALQKAQEQLTSGKRIAMPSDDPAGIARAERALNAQVRGESAQRALAASRNAMTLSESAIGSASDLIQSAREAILAAGNGTYTAAERKSLAVQLREIRSQLMSVANQSDGSTGYLFGGQGATNPPFVDTPSGVQSVATGGASNGAPGENLPLSVDGAAVWLQANSGNGVFATSVDARNSGGAWIDAGQVTDPSALAATTYEVNFTAVPGGATTYTVTDASGGVINDVRGNPVLNRPYVSGKAITDMPGLSVAVSGAPVTGDTFRIDSSTPTLSVFDALDKVVTSLENRSANNSQVMQAVNAGASDMDQALANFQSARARVGETLNRLDGMESRNSAGILAAQTTRSNAEDLDMVQAVSDFTNKQTSYQAALQSYSMVQKLSLFNYLNP